MQEVSKSDFVGSQEADDSRPHSQSEAPRVEETKKAVAIFVDQQTQGMVARDNTELVRMISIMMKGQAFPKSLDTIEKIISCWQVAASLRIPPAIAIQNMAVIHGSVCIWGQLPKALAEATGELEDFKLVLVDEQQTVISLENKNLNADAWAAVCQIRRRGRSTNEYVFSMRDARQAGLDKKTGPWKDYSKIMLQRRAVAHAIKFEFPDALMGVSVSEYDHDTLVELKNVSEQVDQATTQINAMFARKDSK